MYAAFDQLEDVSVVVLTVEYLLRLWSSADDTEHLMFRGADKHPDEAMTRVRWALSFYSLVDLAAILPYFLDAYSLLITRAACGRPPPTPRPPLPPDFAHGRPPNRAAHD